MAYKLNFKFVRNNYNLEFRAGGDERVKTTLQTLLARKNISTSRLYNPTRNSLKVIFPSEVELNKVLENKEMFLSENLTPQLSLSVKATRTIFCAGFDRAILQTYSREDIKTILVNGGVEGGRGQYHEK